MPIITNRQSEEYAEASSKVAKVVEELRKSNPGRAYNPRTASFSEVRTCLFEGRPAERVVVILRATGCRWARAAGGCIMCGHTAAQTTRPVVPEDFVEQFASECAQYDFRKYPPKSSPKEWKSRFCSIK